MFATHYKITNKEDYAALLGKYHEKIRERRRLQVGLTHRRN